MQTYNPWLVVLALDEGEAGGLVRYLLGWFVPVRGYFI